MNVAPSHPCPVGPNLESTAPLTWTGHLADDVAATVGPEPLASLVATADHLTVTSTRGNFRLPRAAITRLGRGNFYPSFFSAVRIHPSVAGYPHCRQFKPLGPKPRELLARLRELGYPVS